MTATHRRPLLPRDDRQHLRTLATHALAHTEDSPNRAYAQGVVDLLAWLDGEDMSPLLQEVSR